MIEIIKAALGIFKTAIDCYIIWAIGPDGTIFDLQSIIKIIISGAILLWQLLKLEWKISRQM